MNPHWPKVQQWQRDDSMQERAGLLWSLITGLLGNSAPGPKYESLLGSNLPVEEIVTSPSLLGAGPNNQELDVGIYNPLKDVAAMVANEDGVPADFIINEVINPIAYHESNRTMNPLIEQKLDGGGVGKGKGMFQFEGKRGVQKAVLDAAGNKKKDAEGNVIMGDDSFDIALKRASRYFKNKDMQIPYWIKDIQPEQDATSLTGDQQKALAILNFKGMANKPNKIEANFGKLYEKFKDVTFDGAMTKGRSDYNDALGEFWKTYHHRKAGEDDKIEVFKSNLANYNMAGELDRR